MTLDFTSSNNRFLFSAELGDLVGSAVNTDAIDLSLCAFTDTFFRTSFVAHNSNWSLYGLRDLIEEYMRTHSLAFCVITIYVNSATCLLNVIYSEQIPNSPAADFYRYHFLTPADTSTLCLGHDLLLPYLARHTDGITPTNDALSVTCRLLFRWPNGDLDTAQWTLSPTFNEREELWQNSLIITNNEIWDNTDGTPLVLNIELSQTYNPLWIRRHTAYFDTRTPDLTLFYFNSFNAPQIAFLFGDLTSKTDPSREIANIGNERIFYDLSNKRTYTFETAALNTIQQTEFEDIISSPDVRIITTPGDFTNATKILITSSECELKNADNDLPRGKFTFEYATAPQRTLISHIPNPLTTIFTTEYTDSFA